MWSAQVISAGARSLSAACLFAWTRDPWLQYQPLDAGIGSGAGTCRGHAGRPRLQKPLETYAPQESSAQAPQNTDSLPASRSFHLLPPDWIKFAVAASLAYLFAMYILGLFDPVLDNMTDVGIRIYNVLAILSWFTAPVLLFSFALVKAHRRW
jgi:hypothetical protein